MNGNCDHPDAYVFETCTVYDDSTPDVVEEQVRQRCPICHRVLVHRSYRKPGEAS